MQTTLPAVQAYASHAKRIIAFREKVMRAEKRRANRSYRRALNAITRTFIIDPEAFDDECFNAPSLSTWDLW